MRPRSATSFFDAGPETSRVATAVGESAWAGARSPSPRHFSRWFLSPLLPFRLSVKVSAGDEHILSGESQCIAVPFRNYQGDIMEPADSSHFVDLHHQSSVLSSDRSVWLPQAEKVPEDERFTFEKHGGNVHASSDRDEGYLRQRAPPPKQNVFK